MLNIGSEALPFEPYIGGKPSPSPEYPQEIVSVGGRGSIGVEITGKNLINADDYYSAYKQADGTYKGENTVINHVGIPLAPFKGKQITISVKTTKPSTITYLMIGAMINNTKVDGEKVFNNNGVIKITVTPVLSTDYFWISYGSGSGEISISDIQLEYGSEATSYEPYKTPRTTTISLSNGLPGIPVNAGGNYTDENGQQYICDEIDFSRGKYVKRVWKGVLDGSSDEKWTYDGKQRARMILNNGNLGTYDKRDIASMCSNLLWNSNVYLDSNRENGYLINNNTFFVRVAESLAINTKPDFIAWLASNPVTLQYVLATPIKTDLTEAQMQAYKSLTTFKPTSIISNDAGAQMEVEYACDTKTWVTNKINTLIKEATTS